MLPSTGLFKSYECPYYDGTTSSSTRNDIETGVTAAATCHRPYCHFKHVPKEESKSAIAVATVQPAPEYKATPKLLALPLPELQLPTAVKKKAKNIEYQPEKPDINASPSKKRKSLDATPIYIPAPTSQHHDNDVNLYLDDCMDEFNELTGIIDNVEATFSNDEDESRDSVKTEIKKEVVISEESKDKEEVSKKSSPKSSNNDKSKQRDSSTSSLHSHSRHKHQKSSSKSKEGTETDKVKKEDEKRKNRDTKHSDRDKEKNKEHKSSRHKSSSSSSSHKSSSRDKNSKEIKSSSSAHKKHISSSASSSSRTKSSSSSKISSSSSSSNKDSSSKKSSKESSPSTPISKTEIMDLVTDDISAIFATTEEDIMKECEMVYDQLEQEFASLHQNNSASDVAKAKAEKANETIKRKAVEEEDLLNGPNRKRIAYKNADKHKSHIPVVVHKPDHRKNAMQAIFDRQDTIKRKHEEEAAAAAAALKEAEKKVHEANEALRKVKEKALTPLIPKSYLTPPSKPIGRSMIAPVANIIAFERAKKKVEELRAEKRPAFTQAQTSKSGPRVAHKITEKATSTEATNQPKPPVLEAHSTKISFNIRMQYYGMMVNHCVAMYPNVADAWERAQTEELTVFKKCNTPSIYKSSAMLAINKLRKEAIDSGNQPSNANKIISHEMVLAGKLANSTSWSVQKKMKNDAASGGKQFDNLSSDKAYEMVYDLRLTENQLEENGYPRAGRTPGTAVIQYTIPRRRPNNTEYYCRRCGKVFNLQMYDDVCVDACQYHPKGSFRKQGYSDNQHPCCTQNGGAPGCCYANYHVTDFVDTDNLTGYVTTINKAHLPTKFDIYALDCEMCYTTQGMELTRVTVVNINSETVFDALVKPNNKIVDYNTAFSGITEKMLSKETRCLRDVQASLLIMFHSKTILVGHSLESDLKALKLIHNVVVDTSVLFPHKWGPPKKRALKNLCSDYLQKIIQDGEDGHDSAEDAEACIQLIKFYLGNKIS